MRAVANAYTTNAGRAGKVPKATGPLQVSNPSQLQPELFGETHRRADPTDRGQRQGCSTEDRAPGFAGKGQRLKQGIHTGELRQGRQALGPARRTDRETPRPARVRGPVLEVCF